MRILLSQIFNLDKIAKISSYIITYKIITIVHNASQYMK